MPEKAIEGVLRERAASGGDSCGTEDTLAAYLEGNLPDRERIVFERHTADCPRCQDVLGLLLRMEEASPATAAGADRAAARSRGVPIRLVVPVAGAAAAVFFVVVGILVFRDHYLALPDKPMPQVAEVRTPSLESELPRPAAPRQKKEEATAEAERDREGSAVKSVPAPPPAPAAPGPRALLSEPKDEPEKQQPFKKETSTPAPSDRADLSGRRESATTAVATGKSAPTAFSEARKGAAEVPAAPALEDKLAVRYSRSANELAKQGTTDSFAPERKALEDFLGAASHLSADAAAMELDGRRFFRWGNYWIENSLLTPGINEFVLIRQGTEDFEELLRQIPRLRELMQPATGILLLQKGKVAVIRR